MAKKGTKVTQKDAEVMQSQAEQMAISNQAMEDIAAIEQQTALLQQEGLNKAHDPEFSGYSDYNGQNPELENLGKIGAAEVREAFETFQKYKEKKQKLINKYMDYEKFWQLEHWDIIDKEKTSKRIKPRSAWLVNTILNKHADAMDNFPEPNILPRAADDEAVAAVLTKVIPAILEQNNFHGEFSNDMWDKFKFGTGITGIFWNNDKDNGLGNIDVKNVDCMSLFWKDGINNIQDSPNVFQVNYMDNDEIKARYPELENIDGDAEDTFNYITYGENVDNTNQSAVIDWYYKRRVHTVDNNGLPMVKTLVHYCKFVGEHVLYASENDPKFAETGWYAHGLYPYVFDVLLPVKANVCGMGYIDLIADDQIFIDKLQRNILENSDWCSRPRSIVKTSGGLNEEEYLDTENAVIHFDGNLGENSFKELNPKPLAGIVENVLLEKIQEMKDTSGNTAASQGQTSNVTTASGIASLQEAAGKLSRDSSQRTYEAFKDICYQVIELIRQFYTEPRCFRIIGETGDYNYVTFDNRALRPQSQGELIGPEGQMIDLGSREPILDIEVKPQKRSAYSKETQNQTALQLYQMGFFAPNNGDASLACLEMMEFDGVDKIKAKVQQNQTLFMQVQQLSALLIQFAPEVAARIGLVDAAAAAQINNQPTGTGGGGSASRGSLSAQAANATRESTAPRS